MLKFNEETSDYLVWNRVPKIFYDDFIFEGFYPKFEK